MIKYRVIHPKEKKANESKPNIVTGGGAYNPVTFPKTQDFLDTEIAKAMANGFVVGAEVVRASFPTKVIKIVGIESDVNKIGGYTKPFFLRTDDSTMLFHPDELLLIEPDIIEAEIQKLLAVEC